MLTSETVFLRVLDYYNGILFLTTNRAGVLDEAFKSRIHYKIYYPDLTLEQTLDIWKLNIQRVRKIEQELAKVENRSSLLINEDELIAFAKQRFLESGNNKRGGRWNGRQIRNAFQVARSLAYYEHGIREDERRTRQPSLSNTNVSSPVTAKDSLPGPPILSVRHFKMMHEITASFENYRTAVHGGTTDADLALEAEYRHDGFRDSLTEGMQAEYRDDHLRAAAAAGGDENADDIDYLTGRMQRPQLHAATMGDDINGAENFVDTSGHRASYTSRNRSGSYLSNPASPPAPGFSPGHNQQQMPFPVPSPRHAAMRDPLSGSLEPGNYLLTTPPRPGYPAPNYSSSPRSNPGAPFGYQPPVQYNDGGGMLEGRYYTPKEYFPPGTNPLLAPGQASGQPDPRAWAGQGYMNQYPVHGREPQPRPGQNVETDLSPDESSY